MQKKDRGNKGDRLLGFDAREMWIDVGFLWPEERRSGFLLREDVSKPLSTDIIVWPSIFDYGDGIAMPNAERERYGMVGLEVPSWIGANVGLWEDLTRMQRHIVDSTKSNAKPHWVIAVSWFSKDGFSKGGSICGPHLEPTSPSVRDGAWNFLGFDVSDGSLLSGLSNCGYGEEDIRVLRPRFQPYLNENHLFSDLAKAFEFSDLTNQSVPEHAPFFVYGLWLIECASPD